MKILTKVLNWFRKSDTRKQPKIEEESQPNTIAYTSEVSEKARRHALKIMQSKRAEEIYCWAKLRSDRGRCMRKTGGVRCWQHGGGE